MKIKDGTVLELRMNNCHGERSFGEDITRLQPIGDDRHRNWMSVQVTIAGKHRGVPEQVLFEIDLPIDEVGKLIAGGPARGKVHWSLDDRLKRAKAKGKKIETRRL